ncbi:MAG: nicotinamide riboside transporter PnuC [Bacteroidia bacterium]|nr:nicotinamide riboside transporter PnuC [Bacteroidia bacterium]NNJ56493.1 nicotinamide mononucleotide transporter [Bacteroidia bacterium]
MNKLLVLEIISFSFNILFILFYIKEIKWCWAFGILGSLSGALLFYNNLLYSETLLYIFYAFMGLYGLYIWNRIESQELQIKRIKRSSVFAIVLFGVAASLGLGFLMGKLDADKTYYDALSTVFGIIATFLEIYKYLVAWLFWILINMYSIWLYKITELDFLAIQMLIYTGLSVYGYFQWKNKLT